MSNARRILLVDDYPDALEMWALYLRMLGYGVATAADGLEAIEQAERFDPDAIVMDLELPGLSGFDAARRIRANNRTRHIPLVAATGYSHARQLQQAREAGFDAVVVKPCAPDELVAAVERLVAAPRHPGRPTEASMAAVEVPVAVKRATHRE